MKHFLNNLTESEKKEILSKYDGSLRVKIDKFTKLVESRLGDVRLHESTISKKVINESTDPNWYKKFPCLLTHKLINRQEDKTEYVIVGSTTGNVYYSNGKAFDKEDGKTKHWWCGVEENTSIFVGDSNASSRLAALKKGLAIPMPGEQTGVEPNTNTPILPDPKDPKWNMSFDCIDNYSAELLDGFYVRTLKDGSIIFPSGRYFDGKTKTMAYWFCKKEEQDTVWYNDNTSGFEPYISQGLAVDTKKWDEKYSEGGGKNYLSGQKGGSEQKKGSGQQGERVKYRDCTNKKTFSLGCMDKRPKDKNEIMKLQGCLGVTPDGKFGLGTLNKFLQLSPESGGVAKIDTIQNICSNIKTAKNLGADDTVPGQ